MPIRLYPGWSIRRAGFSTAEVSMSAMIVSILMAVALDCAGSATRSQVASGESVRAAMFASALLAEILELPFQDPGSAPVFGVETGENTTSRQDFDDVDDYHNWSSTPQSKNGTTLPNSTGMITSARVFYGNAGDLSDSAPASGTSNIKRIVVTVSQGPRTLATMKGVVAK